jgi:hypothetical protein
MTADPAIFIRRCIIEELETLMAFFCVIAHQTVGLRGQALMNYRMEKIWRGMGENREGRN